MSLIATLVVAAGACRFAVNTAPPTPIVVYVTATPQPPTPSPTQAAPTSTRSPSPTPTSLFSDTPTIAVPSPTPTSIFDDVPTATRSPAPTATPAPTFTLPPTAAPTETPAPTLTPPPADSGQPPLATPTPSPAPFDFVITHVRMWTNEENGGVSQNGTAIGCGYGHTIYVWVQDATGSPLSLVVIGDRYNNPRHISGEKGPGHAQYDLQMNGYELYVVEDNNAGRPVTSQVSPVLSAKDEDIPNSWLIEAQYCPTEEDCTKRKASNSLCRGHYSYEITFQRTW